MKLKLVNDIQAQKEGWRMNKWAFIMKPYYGYLPVFIKNEKPQLIIINKNY